jgi:hypothetical protein
MRYFELADELYIPKDRWFLKSLNVVDENQISIWKIAELVKKAKEVHEYISKNPADSTPDSAQCATCGRR